MALEGIEEATGEETQDAAAQPVSASLAAASVRGGVFSSSPRVALPGNDPLNDSSVGMPARHGIFTRKVGAGYVAQVLANSIPLLLVDVLVLAASIGASRILFGYLGWKIGLNVSGYLIAISTGFVLLNIELGLYPGVRLSPVEELRRLVVSVTCIFLVWTLGVAVRHEDLFVHGRFLIFVYLVCLVSLPILRGWTRRLLGTWTNWGVPVLVCGDDPSAVKLYDWLSANRNLGLRPVGVLGNPEALGADETDDWYEGPWSAAHTVAVKKHVYWVVVVPPANDPEALSALIANDLYTIPHIHVLSELTGLPDHWSPHRQLDGLTGIHLQQNLMLPMPRVTKRVMDFTAAVLGSLAISPLLFYIAIMVKLSSRGPVIYGHERIGRGGKRFKAWKFRTMFENSSDVLEMYLEQHPDLKDEWEKDHKLRYDPRITRIGRFLRKTSLDELPQLWNVIRGQMSLVGPRPIVTAEIAKYGPYYGLYTVVKPGITGLWQVSGRNNTTYDERVQLDAYYVRNWSPWMDMYLLLRTIRIVLFAKGAY
jgi:Undecaprenyl-phosphate galactose phosphotransferase WbaP